MMERVGGKEKLPTLGKAIMTRVTETSRHFCVVSGTGKQGLTVRQICKERRILFGQYPTI